MPKIRIGIDVGGTFTHAVAVTADTNEVIAHAVTPTTHKDKDSVAKGVVTVFHDIMEQTGTDASDVCFVAHSTTQATNALLEGDVAKVGIIGLGKGIEGLKAKADTQIKDLELSAGKRLYTEHVYIDSGEKAFSENAVEDAVRQLAGQQCEVIVASEAFSVDDPTNENMVVGVADNHGLPATASHEISQLYGLRVRTRTAVINASILPKMTATALLTDASIKQSGITAPLMIMRSDGGVMDLAQMQQRPILTMLSGPAAGIAAALMYARISDGVFLEVGGTSTDISAIKNGKAMVKSASVGGHLTYLKTLDSRTVGIGGGSMVRMNNNQVETVGPRSAHIAGLPYLAFSNAEELVDLQPKLIQPMPTDPANYLVVENAVGKQFAVTLTDASIVAGMTKEGDYAFSSYEAVCLAFTVIAKHFGLTGLQLAESILDKAVTKVQPVVRDLLAEYELDRNLVKLVGGGGGCTAVVPWLGKMMTMRHMITQKAEVISAIGAAMAMMRDVVERSVIDPTSSDILSIRREAEGRMLAMGAAPDTLEIQTEIDADKNILRAIVTGALQMDNNVANQQALSQEKLIEKAAEAFGGDGTGISLVASTKGLHLFQKTTQKAKLFGLLKKTSLSFKVMDLFGVVKLQCERGAYLLTDTSNAKTSIKAFVEKESNYSDVGMVLPEIFLFYKSRVVDYSSVLDRGQLDTLIQIELDGLEIDEPIVVLAHPRKGQ